MKQFTLSSLEKGKGKKNYALGNTLEIMHIAIRVFDIRSGNKFSLVFWEYTLCIVCNKAAIQSSVACVCWAPFIQNQVYSSLIKIIEIFKSNSKLIQVNQWFYANIGDKK